MAIETERVLFTTLVHVYVMCHCLQQMFTTLVHVYVMCHCL